MQAFLNKYRLIIIIVIEIIAASNVKWGQERWKQVIAFDGKGYYAYLPAIFIYSDLSFAFHDSIEKKYSSQNTFYDYRHQTETGVVNKYFFGTSVAMLPFFLIAHAITSFSGGLADGYSFIYQVAINLSAIFYGLLGFILLIKLLRLYNFSENVITAVILSFALATPLFYYTVFEPSMSHVYSFAFMTTFLFLIKRFSLAPQKQILILSSVIFALIVIIRPVNALIIFAIPFLAGNKEGLLTMLNYIKNNIKELLLACTFFLVITSIQPLIYFLQTSTIFPYSYGKEKLIWTQPEIYNILFSYRKGLFVYAPLLFISVAGFIPLFRRNRFEFFTFILFFIIVCYVLSCWWIWWYGGGFGFRPFIEYYSIFAILFALLISTTRKKIYKITLALSVIFCFVLCQVQTYQYRYFFIHWEKMDKEHYWRIFMRIDQLMKKDSEGNPNRDLLE